MDYIVICCICLFIIYSSIASFLLYYFIKHRKIWNLFWNDLIQLDCPKHSLINIDMWFALFIPGYIPNTPSSNDHSSCARDCARESARESARDCAICEKDERETKADIYQLKTLSSIYEIFKSIDSIISNSTITKNKINKMGIGLFQHLLEYIIRNYKEIRDCDLAIYQKLEKLYLAGVNENEDYKNKNSNQYENKEKDFWQLEDIPMLDAFFENISKLSSLIKNIDMTKIDSTFIIAFLYNLNNTLLDIDSKNVL